MININEKIEEVKKEMNDISIDLVTDYAGCSSYICDAISEHADNNTSIYYHDIKEFISNNFEALENAISEFGWDGCGSDIYKAGQMAEFLENERLIYEDLENIILLTALEMLSANHIEIPEDLLEEIETDLHMIDSNDRFEEIDERVNAVIAEHSESVTA